MSLNNGRKVRQARPSRRSEAGISMLETVIVLSIVGIVAAASVGRLRGAFAQQEIDGWVRAMAKEISGARQTALARRQQVNVIVSSTSYTINTATGTLFISPAPTGTTLTTDCTSSTCSFNRRGVPTMASNGTITITNATAGRTYTVKIETGTGRVTYSAP